MPLQEAAAGLRVRVPLRLSTHQVILRTLILSYFGVWYFQSELYCTNPPAPN